MDDTQRTYRSVVNGLIAPAVLAAITQHADATRLADGLQQTRAARDAIRKGGK